MTRQDWNGLIFLGVIAGVIVWSNWNRIVVPIPPEPEPPPVVVGDMARAMILEETGVMDQSVELGLAATEYLKKQTVVDTDTNGTLIHGWRKWDDDFTDQHLQWSPEPIKQLYKRALADSNGVRPWCVIADKDGNILASQAFPQNLTDQVELLKKYGGE